MFWVSKTFSNIIQLRTEKTYGHATRQPKDIDKNTVAFDAKTVQTVFTSDIALNCHLSKKMIFFIKSQNRQKLFKNDGKTFQRSPRRYIFIN